MSKAESKNKDVTRHTAYGYITSHINYIKDIPAPSEGKWTTTQKPRGLKNQIRNLHDHAIVEQHERTNASSQLYYYTTNRKAYRDIQYVLETFRFTPCGHTGVSNLGDGEYSCGYEFCSEVFGRKEARRALGME